MATSAFAQQDTLIKYVNANFKEVKPEKAQLILKSYKSDSGWKRIMLTPQGMLYQVETSSDAEFSVKHGPYEEYSDGKKTVSGNFVKDKKDGEFFSYRPTGMVATKSVYRQDLLLYNVTYRYDGSKIAETKIGNDKNPDTLISYGSNGKLESTETFDKTGKSLGKVYSDSSGNEMRWVTMENPPTYPGGLDKLFNTLSRIIKYPQDAFNAGVQGTVHISFTITETGTIEDVKVVGKGLYSSLNEEAIRAVKLLGRFNPGTQNGKPVRVLYRIPVKFSLR